MSTFHKCILLTTVLMFFFFTGCSKTNVTGSWKKSDYAGKPFTSILVVAMTGNPNSKLLWENVMADKLRQNGLADVSATISSFPNDGQIDENEIIAYVNKKGIEGVLVTRLVDTKKEQVYYPPSGGYAGGSYGHYSHFNSYYSRAYNQMSTPGYTATETTVLLETNLYEVKTQELIWSMSSDTFDPRSINQLVDSVSKKVLATLKKEGLL